MNDTTKSEAEWEAEYEAHKAIDRLMAEAKYRAEARPLTSESAALFQADIKAAYAQAPERYGWCACAGKGPGEPVCYCEMKQVLKIGGRYYRIRFSGPPKIEDLEPVEINDG